MSIKMYEVSDFIAKTLLNDPNIDAITSTELGDVFHYYVHEDYHRIGQSLTFPYCHSFCYSKETTPTTNTYVVAIEVSAIRIDSEATNRLTTEKTTDKVGTVANAMMESLKNELRQFGINGDKGFVVEGLSEMIIPPRGENDIRYVIEFQLQNKLC